MLALTTLSLSSAHVCCCCYCCCSIIIQFVAHKGQLSGGFLPKINGSAVYTNNSAQYTVQFEHVKPVIWRVCVCLCTIVHIEMVMFVCRMAEWTQTIKEKIHCSAINSGFELKARNIRWGYIIGYEILHLRKLLSFHALLLILLNIFVWRFNWSNVLLCSSNYSCAHFVALCISFFLCCLLRTTFLKEKGRKCWCLFSYRYHSLFTMRKKNHQIECNDNHKMRLYQKRNEKKKQLAEIIIFSPVLSHFLQFPYHFFGSSLTMFLYQEKYKLLKGPGFIGPFHHHYYIHHRHHHHY